jgi:hypothetical protein
LYGSSSAAWGKRGIGGGVGQGEKAAVGQHWGDGKDNQEGSDHGVRDMSEISKGFICKMVGMSVISRRRE